MLDEPGGVGPMDSEAGAGAMKIHQQITIAQPLEVVWRFFHDAPAVAACLPGAEYVGPAGEDVHKGRVGVKVGPFRANFEGEAQVLYQDESKSVRFEGKGVDRKGAIRGRMTMDCRLTEAGRATQVDVEADVQLSGNLAQFGRTGLIKEVATALTAEFVKNADKALAAARADVAAPEAAAPQPAARPISGLALLWAAVRAWFRRLVGRPD
ncbi:MAG: SRPBCC family protein [Acetobacteraceae bacterium]